jgi:energy-coupling factor transporter ATP-binding protein EcfA2
MMMEHQTAWWMVTMMMATLMDYHLAGHSASMMMEHQMAWWMVTMMMVTL